MSRGARPASAGARGAIALEQGPLTSVAAPTRHRGSLDAQRARLWYIDWLRTAVLVMVFVVHVGEVFTPWDEWHITNAARSRAVGEIVVLLAPWIMPLMMLLCGVSAWFSLQRRSNAEYVRERVVRVLIPLVVGTLLLVPPQVYLERRMRGQFHGSFIAFLPTFFTTGVYPRGNLSWHHLWFLGHLLGYSLLALPLFRLLQHAHGARLLEHISSVGGARGRLLWLAVPLIMERQLLWRLSPERHMLTADWSNHALLFVAYVYGFLFAGLPRLRAAVDAEWKGALLIAVLGMGALGVGTWRDVLPGRLPPPYSGVYLLFWSLYALYAWAWMVAMLGIARRWLDRDGWATRYGRAVGYVWYLVHQPVIVAIAYWLVPWNAGVATKVVVLAAGSLAGTLAIVEVVRRVPLLGPALGAARRPADLAPLGGV